MTFFDSCIALMLTIAFVCALLAIGAISAKFYLRWRESHRRNVMARYVNRWGVTRG